MLANVAHKLGLNNKSMMPLSSKSRRFVTPTILGNWQGFLGFWPLAEDLMTLALAQAWRSSKTGSLGPLESKTGFTSSVQWQETL